MTTSLINSDANENSGLPYSHYGQYSIGAKRVEQEPDWKVSLKPWAKEKWIGRSQKDINAAQDGR